ncbi:MAG: hypothetical protein ACREDR_26800 [Blastocatellia bacterium]
MPEDKIIKSGQITAPRILFLALCGAVLVVIVAEGYLKIGYMLLTAVLCVLLGLIAADYGVAMDHVDLAATPAPAGPPVSGLAATTNSAAVAGAGGKGAVTSDISVKVKKKSGRAPKRRR